MAAIQRAAVVAPSSLPISRRVAVIGAGPSGIVSARELRREGHQVVVFEKNDQIGGTWIYTPEIESDPLGLDPNRPIIHTSLYESLRTNLPREVMGFRDYPFVTREGKFRDPRRFPGHTEVLMYLQEFSKEFGVEEMVRFETEVVSAELVDGGKWKVKSKRKRLDSDDAFQDEIFDALVVCVGHHTEPCIAEIPGVDSWPGKQMHSHNYRTPEPFRDQVVILIGGSYTASDLSVEIAGVAKEVHIASRSVKLDICEKLPGRDNMWLHPMIVCANGDGTVAFQDGSVIRADVILHCTGYKYHFPFLKTIGTVTVEDNCVGPLYGHVFPPVLAPSLSFVGIPWKAALFPVFELQSKWVAAVLSRRVMLPSQEEMMKDVNNFYLTLEASGIPKRYTHNIYDYWADYPSWVAAQCRCPGLEEWRKQMHRINGENMLARPMTFRDEWDDHHLIVQAYEDFRKYNSSIGVCKTSIAQ